MRKSLIVNGFAQTGNFAHPTFGPIIFFWSSKLVITHSFSIASLTGDSCGIASNMLINSKKGLTGIVIQVISKGLTGIRTKRVTGLPVAFKVINWDKN